MKPYFTIGIPVYNEEKRIEDTIKSIQSQDIVDFEIICVDDCSTDSSYEILERMALVDNRIKVYKNDANRGIAFTRERICNLASGLFYIWCDSDDKMESGCLKSLKNILRRYENKKVVIIQNAQVNNMGKLKSIYSLKTQKLDASKTAKMMAIGNKWYSYPWTIVGTTDIFKTVHYPVNAKEYVDDQLASYKYLEKAECLIYLNRINYTHYLYDGSDSHNPTFYKRLSNTYKYIRANGSIDDSNYLLTITIMEKISLAWYYSKMEYSTKRKKQIRRLSISLRKIKYLYCFKWLENKYRIIALLFILFPNLFYCYYNKRKLL